MAGLLSKLTGATGENREAAEQETRLVPIDPADTARKAKVFDSIENADLAWFWASDASGRLIYISQPACKALGVERGDIIGRFISEVFDSSVDSNGERNERSLKFVLAARNSINALPVGLPMARSESWWEISAKPQLSSDGEFGGYHGIAKDISSTFEQQRTSERLSQFDSLTGLANRHRMASKLDSTLAAFRASKRSCGLLMIDLDRFKQVNDTMGHPAGDELLKQVAERIKRIVGDRGEIGRLGGDEFQVILPDSDDRGVLGDLAQRTIQMISQPYSINGMRAVIGCSVGIAVAPYDGIEEDEVVNAADLALYAAKGAGRGQYRFYSSDLKDSVSHRHQIEEDLRDAISREELQIHFQPIVDAKTHHVTCMEALMRWEHHERGMISPADFIPVAEEVGLIREIGEWALNHVCQEMTKMPETIRAAVNVSAVQFSAEDFVSVVERALKASGVNPNQIELEITESVFVGDLDRAFAMFKRLKGLGVKLALDDFGTGYSSLSYLRDAPFDKIKIDQTFVRGCSADGNNNKAIVAAVVSLAKALGMETVAEGVEAKDELKAVTEQGVSHLQGILFSRAVPIERIKERIGNGELKYEPQGPNRYRADRRTEFRRIGLIHGDHRYNVFLRNLSKTGAKVEGLLGVEIGTDIVLDLGGGQLAVATVRRSEGSSQGLEFETPLISDGAEGLCTRHRVSPYQIEAAGKPLRALGKDPYSALAASLASPPAPRDFVEVEIGPNG
ncbi:MAG: EAL domain-containing protein [Pseudomonadota bacterium]